MRRRYKPKKLMDTNIFKVICLPTDVDIGLQITTGRLLRECGFGQTEFWVENFVHDALATLKGEIKVTAYHMTYEYPIKMFETFKIIAKIVYWDDTSCYMKQTVMRNLDKKECATILSIHRLTGVTTSQVLNVLGKDCVQSKQVLSNLVRKLQEINMDISKKL
ncbi:protein THEM6-like isoform X2 [Mercenaria mercenaria]|nr:protein THEM6-like isoform X2 [Mercenaria mercenaria]